MIALRVRPHTDQGGRSFFRKLRIHSFSVRKCFRLLGRQDTVRLVRLKLLYRRGHIEDYRLVTISGKLGISRSAAGRLLAKLKSTGMVTIDHAKVMRLCAIYGRKKGERTRYTQVKFSKWMSDQQILALMEASVVKDNLRAQGFMIDLKNDLKSLKTGNDPVLSGRFKDVRKIIKERDKYEAKNGKLIQDWGYIGLRLSDSKAASLLDVKTSYYRRTIKKRIANGCGLRLTTEFERVKKSDDTRSYSALSSSFVLNGIRFRCFTRYEEVETDKKNVKVTGNQSLKHSLGQKVTLFPSKTSIKESFAYYVWR